MKSEVIDRKSEKRIQVGDLVENKTTGTVAVVTAVRGSVIDVTSLHIEDSKETTWHPGKHTSVSQHYWKLFNGKLMLSND